MQRFCNMVRGFLCRHCPRYKLRQICQAIGIKPYRWQWDFAMQKRVPDELSGGRQNGKTMAVMLRLLMLDPSSPFTQGRWQSEILFDKDFIYCDVWRVRWYTSEYKRLAQLCAERGIPVVTCDIKAKVFQFI